jgi:hypothetical protein
VAFFGFRVEDAAADYERDHCGKKSQVVGVASWCFPSPHSTTTHYTSVRASIGRDPPRFRLW